MALNESEMVGRTTPPYPAEVRAEAVHLARSRRQPLRVTAQDPGVSVEALRSWVRQAAVDAGERDYSAGYRLPTCAPPSTCSTSPVT